MSVRLHDCAGCTLDCWVGLQCKASSQELLGGGGSWRPARGGERADGAR